MNRQVLLLAFVVVLFTFTSAKESRRLSRLRNSRGLFEVEDYLTNTDIDARPQGLFEQGVSQENYPNLKRKLGKSAKKDSGSKGSKSAKKDSGSKGSKSSKSSKGTRTKDAAKPPEKTRQENMELDFSFSMTIDMSFSMSI
jgi:hypothetical protein